MRVRNLGEIAGESPYFNIEGTIQSARGTVQYSGIHFQSFNFLSTARMATVNTYVKVYKSGAIRIHGIIVTHVQLRATCKRALADYLGALDERPRFIISW